MLRADLWDYSDAYIVVQRSIAVTAQNNEKQNKGVASKKNAPFINCIWKINNVLIDKAEDLGVVMPMYNLLEYSKKQVACAIVTGMKWPSDLLSSNSESFKYKTSIKENIYNLGAGDVDYGPDKVCKNESQVFISLKHLSNFWRTLTIQLINCEMKLILTWSKNYVLADMKLANNPHAG